jgi:hypothetical protein
MTTTTTETPTLEGKGLRNFRNSADVENFYRFVHENGLRREAKLIMSAIVSHLNKGKKKTRKKRKSKKLQ